MDDLIPLFGKIILALLGISILIAASCRWGIRVPFLIFIALLILSNL
jgi:hypothetical protein